MTRYIYHVSVHNQDALCPDVHTVTAFINNTNLAGGGSTSNPEVPNPHCTPRRSSRPPRRATEHAGGRSRDPPRSAGGHPVDSWRPVINK